MGEDAEQAEKTAETATATVPGAERGLTQQDGAQKAVAQKAVAQKGGAPIERPPLPGAGTPDGEALRGAWADFDVGDYRAARAAATRLASAGDTAVADSARDLLRRTGVDPVQIAFLVVCLVALAAVAAYYLPQGGAPP